MRTAFVTGASRGIGRASAIALAEAGNRVAFCYARDEDAAKETQSAIEAAGADALAIRADVGDREAVGGAFDEIEAAWGPVELLVNNAGITHDGVVARMTDAAWDDVIRVNLTAAFATIRRAAGRPRAGQLRRRQSRAARALPFSRQGARAARHHLQRRRTGAYRDLHDGGHARGLAGPGQ